MDIGYVYAIVTLFLFILGFILHNSRSESTKATNYLNNLKNKSNEKKDKSDHTLDDVKVADEDTPIDDSNVEIKKEQTAQYLMLLEMHKNNIYKKHLQENINNVDEDKYNELDDYLSFSELSKLLGIDVEETISFFIREGLVSRDRYTLILTEKGIDIGGEYITHEEVTWIEFPKDIFNKLEYESRPIQPIVKEYKNDNDTSFWFIVIIVVLVYFLFFR